MKQILAAIFCLFLITWGCVEHTTKVEWVNPEGIGFQTEKDTMSVQALRTTPGAGAGNNGWMYEYQKAGLDTTGFALMSQDSNGLRQMMVTDEALDARYQGMISDSLSNFESIDSLYQENDSLKLLSYNVRQPVVAFDAMDEVAGTLPNGTMVFSRDNSAWYRVQDSVSGFSPDGQAVIDLGSNVAALLPEGGLIQAKHLGFTTSSDNSTAFSRLYNYMEATGYGASIDAGQYSISTLKSDTDSNLDFYMEGKGDVVLNVTDTDLGNFWNATVSTFSTDDIIGGTRQTDTFQIRGASVLEAGDIISLEQSDVVTGVGNVAETMEVYLVLNDSTVQIKGKLLFTHDANVDNFSILRVYKNRQFHMKNIEINMQYDYGSTGDQGLQLRGYNGVFLDNVRFITGDTARYADGVTMYGCVNVNITNCEFNGLRYGALVNNCKQVHFEDITATRIRHICAVSTWCQDVDIYNAYAHQSRSPIESHEGWNIRYSNIRGHQSGKITLRGFGDLEISNCNIQSDNSEDQSSNYSLIGDHFAWDNLAGTEFEYLVQGTDIKLENIRPYLETSGAGQFSGLSATGFKTLTINNCIANSIGAYDNTDNGDSVTVYINNCRTGLLYAVEGAHEWHINNIIFDGSLNAQTYLIAKTTIGEMNFNYVRFQNTDSMYLLNTWFGTANTPSGFRFNDAKGTIRTLAATTSGGSNPSNRMFFYATALSLSDTLATDYSFGQINDHTFRRGGAFLSFSDATLYETDRTSSGQDEWLVSGTNRGSVIDGEGINFKRSAGDYTQYLGPVNPTGGAFSDDLYMNSRDQIFFQSNGDDVATVDERGFQMLNDEPIFSEGNDILNVRAGNGNSGNTAGVRMQVKNDLQVAYFAQNLITTLEGPLHIRDDSLALDRLGLNIGIRVGTSEPTHDAENGSLYLRQDNDSTLYTKTSAGWVSLN